MSRNLEQDLFEVCVQKVFSGWTALQLAVEHEMGGYQSKALVLDFINVISELFFTSKNNECDHQFVADKLFDFMDEKLQTYCEDDSPKEVAAVLITFYNLCKQGNEDIVNAELHKLPPSQWQLCKETVITKDDNVLPSVAEKPENLEDEDGWRTVPVRHSKLNQTINNYGVENRHTLSDV